MALQQAKEDLQRKLGNRSPDAVSTSALDIYVQSLCDRLQKAANIHLIEHRLTKADTFQSGFFEILTAQLMQRASAHIDFIPPSKTGTDPDFKALFRDGTVVHVEVTSLASKAAAKPGRHFISDDLTDEHERYRGEFQTVQSILRQRGEGVPSLAAQLRGVIRRKARQLPASDAGIVAIALTRNQQIFMNAFQEALWGRPNANIYRRQTKITRIPIWESGTPTYEKPDGLLVLLPWMTFEGADWPTAPSSWTFLLPAFLFNHSLPKTVVRKLARVGAILAKPAQSGNQGANARLQIEGDTPILSIVV